MEMFTISPATVQDIPQLVSLVNSAYRGDSSREGWTTEADLLEGIRTDQESLRVLLGKTDTVILSYWNHQKEMLGCVHLQKEYNKLYLGMLTVSPQQQARGIGKQLLSAATGYALQHNCKSIVMTVISVRQELIAWYIRHGYRQTGEIKPFPDDPRFGIPKKPLEFVVLEKAV